MRTLLSQTPQNSEMKWEICAHGLAFGPIQRGLKIIHRADLGPRSSMTRSPDSVILREKEESITMPVMANLARAISPKLMLIGFVRIHAIGTRNLVELTLLKCASVTVESKLSTGAKVFIEVIH